MSSLKPVSPGQPLSISAGDYNAMLDAARAHRLRQRLAVDEPSSKLQAGIILVRNATASDRDFLDVLAIDAPLILPTDSLNEWRSRVALSCIEPDSATHAGRYVVLQEPIPAGKMGRAMVIGVTPVNLDVTAETDRFAEVVTSVSTSLKTGTTGSARILWKEAGTGAKRGVVMLTGEAPAISPPHTDTVDPTVNDDSDAGYALGTIWINTTTNQYFVATNVTVAAAVWVSIKSPHAAASNPAVTDDSAAGFEVGSIWVNTTTDQFFIAVDVSSGAAVWVGSVIKPTEDGTVYCSKSDLSGGEWDFTVDIGRNAVSKAGVLTLLSPDASGAAVVIDAALVPASSKQLNIREIDICDAGVAKKMLVLGSAPY